MEETQAEIHFTPTEFGRSCDPPLTGARISQLVDSGAIRGLKTPSGRRFIPASELQRFMATRKRRVEA